MAVSKTPYTGKHSAGPVKQSKEVGGEKTPYKGKHTNESPASAHGGSLGRKGKHELTPYGGK